MSDPALVYENPAITADQAGTHVLIIGVGDYLYGKGKAAATKVGGSFKQLSSPPISARAIADWFIRDYRNSAKPLASVAMLLSESNPQAYQPPRPEGAAAVSPPPADLAGVEAAVFEWSERLKGNQDNMAVFYFCGHGLSLGDQASLLLSDFGHPRNSYKGAIDLTELCGTMKNSNAIQQAFLLDCCRTQADGIFVNETRIGTRVLSLSVIDKDHDAKAQQFVLFPTIIGEQAFGAPDQVSIYSKSMIDALSFAAASDDTGKWKTDTARLLSQVDKLVSLRLPPLLSSRSKPNAVDASVFEFNEIDEPKVARSFVTLSDSSLWSEVKLQCVQALAGTIGATVPQSLLGDIPIGEKFCQFQVPEGKWRFTGTHDNPARQISADERTVRLPVAYVTLTVQ